MFPLVSFGILLNVDLKFSASDLTFYYASIFLPWNFRAFYGLISDAVPIRGSRRRVYMSVCYACVAVCFVTYGCVVISLKGAFLSGVILNIFFSFSEAVLDALAVDLVTSEPSASVSTAARIKRCTDIQSAGMTFRTAGSLLAAPIAGGLSTILGARAIISLSAIFPIMSLFVCCVWIKEDSRQPDPLHKRTKEFVGYIQSCWEQKRFPTEFLTTVKPVLLPSLFVLLYAASPSSNQAFSNFLFTSIAFSPMEYHAIALCATVGGLLGTIAYWGLLRDKTSLRTSFVISVIVSAFAACSRLLVVHYWQSIWFVCIDEALVNVAFRFALMPVQVYAAIAASAPEHLMYEGFVYGVFMSIENWGGTLSGVVSGLLADRLSLSALVVVSAGVSFVPLLALSLLKTPDTTVDTKIDDDSAEQRTEVPL